MQIKLTDGDLWTVLNALEAAEANMLTAAEQHASTPAVAAVCKASAESYRQLRDRLERDYT